MLGHAPELLQYAISTTDQYSSREGIVVLFSRACLAQLLCGGRGVRVCTRRKFWGAFLQRCLRDSPEPWRRVVQCPEVCPVTEIEGVGDVGDAERRGVEGVDGAAVSMNSSVPRLSMMLEGVPDEMDGLDLRFLCAGPF